MKSEPAPADTDKDGMPDGWENAKGLNPGEASDASKDRDGDGYTNIEEYINGLVKGTVTMLDRKRRSLVPMYNRSLKLEKLSQNRVRISILGFDDEFKIFGWDGRLLFRGFLNNGLGEFNTSLWPAGVYFVHTGNHTGKWFKMAK